MVNESKIEAGTQNQKDKTEIFRDIMWKEGLKNSILTGYRTQQGQRDSVSNGPDVLGLQNGE